MGARARARREAAVLLQGRCPRCSSPRRPAQRYCLECGLPLPRLSGRLARARATWVRRLGWYPGDFVFAALAALAIAAAGAVAAIEVSRSRTPGGRGTIVEPPPTAPASAAAAAVDGRTPWPAGEEGWTVVIASFPVGHARGAALLAHGAASAGLPQVGVIASAAYPSLPPGYEVVFSGIYASPAAAASALRDVQGRGYGGAYTVEVAP